MVQINAVIKSFKKILVARFRSDGPDLLQQDVVSAGNPNPCCI